jgi:peptidyl-prolyl cis-trans isomerase A (cyclophilin A)
MKLISTRSILGLIFCAALWCEGSSAQDSTALSPSWLLKPTAPEMNRQAPALFDVALQTSKGKIVIEVHRDWAPHGADRFYNLARAGYYDNSYFFRVVRKKWAQFGVYGETNISTLWRTQTIPDDPGVQSNVRGTVAFAFSATNGRTTQVFINLADNTATHDAPADAMPFVPFGKVIEGMEAADALNAEYGENAGSGIRSGKQGPLFEKGNAWLKENFPRLDLIQQAGITNAVK